MYTLLLIRPKEEEWMAKRNGSEVTTPKRTVELPSAEAAEIEARRHAAETLAAVGRVARIRRLEEIGMMPREVVN